MIVQQQLNVNALDALLLLLEKSIASDKVFVELHAPRAAALEWRRKRVQVLAPKREKLLHSQGTHSVVAAVLDAELLSLVPQLRVDLSKQTTASGESHSTNYSI